MTTHVKVAETHEAVDKLAAERVLKTRTDVILTNRFYGVLVSNVDPVLSRKFPTAATNGKQHFFNPEFVERLYTKELKFVQRHESEHDARHHSTRRGGRDMNEWNIACDYAINIDLVDEIAAGDDTMELPREEVLGGKPYVDAKYRGMSAEDIYRSRELDRQRAEQEKAKQPQPQEGDGDDEDDANDDAGNEEAGDNADKDPGDEAGDNDGDEAGDEAGDEGDEAGADGRGKPGKGDSDEAEEAGDEAGEETGGASSAADEETDTDSQEGDGGEGDGDGDGDEGTGDGEGGEDGDEPVSATGDMPGGMGEVLDAADDPAEISDEEVKWERVVRQAATIGKGDMPGHMIREIDRANQPKQDWREVLRAYFDQGASRIETWNRPNRRFAGQNVTLPGSQREGLNEVVFLIDTSGSVDDIALAAVGAEAQAALDEGIIDKLYVVFGDTRVTAAAEYTSGDEIDFTPNGRGGTAMRPLFDWASENVDNPSLTVCFTDGYIETEEGLGPHPAGEVLWAFHGYPDAVREMIKNAPWGAPGIDVGAH